MGETVKWNHYFLFFIIFIMLVPSVHSLTGNYDFFYNPFTAKQDRSLSVNQTGFNITADNFFGNFIGSIILNGSLTGNFFGNFTGDGGGLTNITADTVNISTINEVWLNETGDRGTGNFTFDQWTTVNILNFSHLADCEVIPLDELTNFSGMCFNTTNKTIMLFANGEPQQSWGGSTTIFGSATFLDNADFRNLTGQGVFLDTNLIVSGNTTTFGLYIGNGSELLDVCLINGTNCPDNITATFINIGNWSNVTIFESQILDLNHTVDTDSDSNTSASNNLLFCDDSDNCGVNDTIINQSISDEVNNLGQSFNETDLIVWTNNSSDVFIKLGYPQVIKLIGNLIMPFFNITAENYLNGSGDLEWIRPENIFDVDKEDIETDINTFVDIGGDVMTNDLVVEAHINASNWSNVTIFESQILDLNHFNDSLLNSTITSIVNNLAVWIINNTFLHPNDTQNVTVGFETELDNYGQLGIGIDEFITSENVTSSTFNGTGAWQFEEGSGTNASDSSNNSNDGVISGAIYVGSKGNGENGTGNFSLLFDGINDEVTVTDDNALDLQDDLTYCVWANTTQSSKGHLIHKFNGATGYGLNIEGGGRYKCKIGGANAESTATIYDDGIYHHICCRQNATKAAIFIDGVFDSEMNRDGGATVNTANLFFGSKDGGEYFEGNLDEVMIFNTSITENEILEIYHNGTGDSISKTSEVNTTNGGITFLVKDDKVGINTNLSEIGDDIGFLVDDSVNITGDLHVCGVIQGCSPAKFFGGIDIMSGGLTVSGEVFSNELKSTGRLESLSNDLKISSSDRGVIMTAPNGTGWLLHIDDNGNLFTTQVSASPEISFEERQAKIRKQEQLYTETKVNQSLINTKSTRVEDLEKRIAYLEQLLELRR
jgi:hypothetical protein